jgi:hypothetical protein
VVKKRVVCVCNRGWGGLADKLFDEVVERGEFNSPSTNPSQEKPYTKRAHTPLQLL